MSKSYFLGTGDSILLRYTTRKIASCNYKQWCSTCTALQDCSKYFCLSNIALIKSLNNMLSKKYPLNFEVTLTFQKKTLHRRRSRSRRGRRRKQGQRQSQEVQEVTGFQSHPSAHSRHHRGRKQEAKQTKSFQDQADQSALQS